MLQSEPLMSTKPQVLKDDLDRTDELPVLDVEAYEASLTSTQQGLARTDTWAVEALRDLEELTEVRQERSESIDVDARDTVGSGALTVNVDSILKRIAELETEIVAAHEANKAIQKRNEAVLADKDELQRRFVSIEAENARISEARALEKEMAQRTEHKLREQLEIANQKFQELSTARTAELGRAGVEQAKLQQRIEQQQSASVELQERCEELQQRLQASMTIAAQRADSLMAMEASLNQEKTLKAQLSRQFAAKLTDYDKLSSILDLRDHAVEALSADRDVLNDRLRQQRETIAGLTNQLDAAKQSAEQHRTLLRERENELAERETQLAQLNGTVMQLQTSLEELQLRASNFQAQITDIATARDTQEQRNLELSAELNLRASELERAKLDLDQSRDELAASQASSEAQLLALEEQRAAVSAIASQLASRGEELARSNEATARLSTELAEVKRDAQAKIDQLTQERERLLPLAAELAARQNELEQRVAEIDQLHEELVAARKAAQQQVDALIEERDALLPAAEELETRTVALDEAMSEVAQLREELLAVHASAENAKRLLQEKTEEVASLESKVRESAMAVRGMEVAILARDELAQQLRDDLQTARDERAIVAGQLEKARKRVKSLSEEIFKRDHEIAELRTDLGVHSEALAAIRRDVNRIGKDAEAEQASDVERFLEPIEHSGPVIALTAKMLTIGRTTETDVCLPSKLVSRHHARLLVGPNGVIVEDAGSTNGCFVNGKQVRKHLMHEGDVLELGDLRYRLRTQSPHDTRTRDNVVPFDKSSS